MLGKIVLGQGLGLGGNGHRLGDLLDSLLGEVPFSNCLDALIDVITSNFSLFELGDFLSLLFRLGLNFREFDLIFLLALDFRFMFDLLLKLQLFQEVFVSDQDAVGVAYKD